MVKVSAVPPLRRCSCQRSNVVVLGQLKQTSSRAAAAPSRTRKSRRAAWKRGSWTLYGELLNAFDRRGKDIVYWYETYLPGLDAEPTEGRVSRVEEPRTVRVGLRFQF